jgi:chromate reductase
MSPAIHILGISGSLRRASFNTRLLNIAAGMLPENVTFELFDLNPLPMYNSDLQEHGYPEPVEHFHARLSHADALLISTPEYNHSVTGALKNAMDWASRPSFGAPQGTLSFICYKPTAIMGVGGRGGTVRAQAHLREIAAHTNMMTLEKPEVLISNSGQRAFDQNGNLIDMVAAELVAELVNNLVQLTLQVKAERGHNEPAQV